MIICDHHHEVSTVNRRKTGKDNNPKYSVLGHPQLQKGNFCLAVVLTIYHSVAQIAVFAVASNFGMFLLILR